MKPETFTLSLLISFFSLLSHSQDRLLMLDGSTREFTSIKVEKESVVIHMDGTETIPKSSILCVIPGKKAGYTFHSETNKKSPVKKKDITNNYSGTDIPKLLAYKLYNTDVTGDQAAEMFPHDLTKPEFASVYDEMQNTIKKRIIVGLAVGIPAAVVALTLGLSSFLHSLKEAQQFSQEIQFNYPLRDFQLAFTPIPGLHSIGKITM